MATQWGDLAAQIYAVLLEPEGPELGLFTDEEMYTAAQEVLADFLAATGIAKHIVCVPFLFTVPTYAFPSELSMIEAANADRTHLYETSDFYLSNTDPQYETQYGMPETYHQDNLPSGQVEVSPAPDYNGDQVEIAQGQGGYGVISSVVDAPDIVLTATSLNPGYGVIIGADGPSLLDTLNPGYGVNSVMCASTNNLELLGTAAPTNATITADSYIELVPDDFVPYLKYGILARLFSTNSELKSMTKADYCRTRYMEGVMLLAAITGQSQG